MSGTQKAKQNKPSLDPGLCLRQNREDELRDLRANLSARVPSSPTLHASFSQEPRRYRSVCWAARKSDCTAIARGAVKAWQRRSHPETARNSDGSARRAKRPHRKHFVPRAPRRPPRRLRPRGHNNCYDPGWPRQSGYRCMKRRAEGIGQPAKTRTGSNCPARTSPSAMASSPASASATRSSSSLRPARQPSTTCGRRTTERP